MANINDRINGQEFESASPLAHAVRYDRAQVKTEEQKKQARENIGCYCEAGGGGGDSSGGGAFFIPITVEFSEVTDAVTSITSGKTAEEITTASQTSALFLEEVGEGYRIVVPIKALSYAGSDDLGYSFTLTFDGYIYGVGEGVELKAAAPGEYPTWVNDK